MDPNRFDDLTKSLATGLTRRRALGGLVGALGSIFGLGSSASASRCHHKGQVCAADADCCGALQCTDGVCSRPSRDKPPRTRGCEEGQTRCHGACVTIANDQNNCGACGNVCPATTPVCSDGACICTDSSTCGEGMVCCGGTCVAGDCCGDGDCDAASCQTCQQNTCASTCSGSAPDCDNAGHCICTTNSECAAGHVCCSGTCITGDCCIDGDCDTANCQTCQQNTCTSKCGGSAPDCNGSGGCICTTNTECGNGEVCCGGTCVAGTCCADTDCGACGTCDTATHTCIASTSHDGEGCGTGGTCVDGACCATPCGAGATLTCCADGTTCTSENVCCASGTSCGEICCDAGYGCCSGTCKPLNTNTDCGTCGHSCNLPNATGACDKGSCLIVVCNDGFANCNGAIGDGCEVDIKSDRNNCGSCGNACAANEVCLDGSCSTGCIIDGTQYASGALHASAGSGSCESCQPDVSTTSWTPRASGETCLTGSGDLTGSCCGQSGECCSSTNLCTCCQGFPCVSINVCHSDGCY